MLDSPSDQPKLALPASGEGRDGEVDVRVAQRRRHLGADARPALGHDREEEPGDIDAAPVELRRQVLRQRAPRPVITGMIGVSPGRQLEAGLRQVRRGSARAWPHEPGAQIVGLFGDLDAP